MRKLIHVRYIDCEGFTCVSFSLKILFLDRALLVKFSFVIHITNVQIVRAAFQETRKKCNLYDFTRYFSAGIFFKIKTQM